MKRWISMGALALVACGGGGDNNDGPSTDGNNNNNTQLACDAVTYCSTWSADSTEIEAPVERGGPIGDGLYRLERGTFSVELLQFAGNQFNKITDSFDNWSGTYATASGMISFTYTTRCDRDGSTDAPLDWNDRPYLASGDTLLIGMADSGQGVVWYEYKRIQVDQICTENTSVKCSVTNCSCAFATGEFGTVSSGIKACSSP